MEALFLYVSERALEVLPRVFWVFSRIRCCDFGAVGFCDCDGSKGIAWQLNDDGSTTVWLYRKRLIVAARVCGENVIRHSGIHVSDFNGRSAIIDNKHK